MQESPIEKLNKQFDILATQGKDYIIRDYITPKIVDKTITWKNEVKQNPLERSMKAQKYFNFCQQYIAFFRSKSYQFLFNDYSLGRFSYEFDEDNLLVSYNLYWCPCPLSKDFIDEIEQNGLDVSDYIDNIQNKEKIELDHIILRSPIRFDYIREYNDKNIQFHPYFHMHFQEKDTRAKTEKIFSLYSYMLFILENCYPEIYRDKRYGEKIESIRKLETETLPWFKLVKNSRNIEIAKKIHTKIVLN